MFNATWYPEQVTFSDGKMKLQIDKEDDEEAVPEYKAGELRTNQFYQYGLFEVNMKPAKSTGTVSSFFTYTGPWDWDNDPWDEIDIEFLGKDTTRVQFNYFTNGVGNNEHYHDLGFDASESFNTYAFEWRPDSISWYVNGELVYTATENIPQTPQKIMMNLWPGIGVDAWTGVFDGEDTPVVTEYDWVRYTPLEELDDNGVQPEPEIPVTPETPETPEAPEVPETPETPVVEDGETGETVVDKEKGNETGGKKLPNTATSLYNYLAIGLLILATGAFLYYRSRKKIVE
nr:family 16 glycosylhydrolase [Bacillus alkalicellulosilyticus]